MSCGAHQTTLTTRGKAQSSPPADRDTEPFHWLTAVCAPGPPVTNATSRYLRGPGGLQNAMQCMLFRCWNN